MRKRLSGRKFGRTSNERKQLFRNLIRSMAAQGSIETSLAKAKAIRPQVEKLVTTAKVSGLSVFRRLMQETGTANTAKQLVSYGQLFAKRPGGYTRIVRLGHQQGDNTESVRIEFVEKLEKAVVVPQVAPKTEEKAPVKTEGVQSAKKVALKKESVKQVKKVKTKSKSKKS